MAGLLAELERRDPQYRMGGCQVCVCVCARILVPSTACVCVWCARVCACVCARAYPSTQYSMCVCVCVCVCTRTPTLVPHYSSAWTAVMFACECPRERGGAGWGVGGRTCLRVHERAQATACVRAFARVLPERVRVCVSACARARV